MGIPEIQLQKDTLDAQLNSAVGVKVLGCKAWFTIVSVFMENVISVLTAQDAAITTLQQDMANRMLCTKYKAD